MSTRKVCPICHKSVRRGSKIVFRGASVIHVKCVPLLRSACPPLPDFKQMQSGDRGDE